MDDPLPREALNDKSDRVPYSNYKTIKCCYFYRDRFCPFGIRCSYAHGDFELRSKYDPIYPPLDTYPPVPPHLFFPYYCDTAAPQSPQQFQQQIPQLSTLNGQQQQPQQQQQNLNANGYMNFNNFYGGTDINQQQQQQQQQQYQNFQTDMMNQSGNPLNQSTGGIDVYAGLNNSPNQSDLNRQLYQFQQSLQHQNLSNTNENQVEQSKTNEDDDDQTLDENEKLIRYIERQEIQQQQKLFEQEEKSKLQNSSVSKNDASANASNINNDSYNSTDEDEMEDLTDQS